MPAIDITPPPPSLGGVLIVSDQPTTEGVIVGVSALPEGPNAVISVGIFAASGVPLAALSLEDARTLHSVLGTALVSAELHVEGAAA